MPKEDPLIDALNLPASSRSENKAHEIMPQDDFEIARRNTLEMMQVNSDALRELIDLAAVSQHPRMFEVAGQLIKVGLESSRDLAELSRKKAGEQQQGPTSVHNTLILTSEQALDKIKGRP